MSEIKKKQSKSDQGLTPCAANPDLWYATKAEAVQLAIAGCATCPVMQNCRDWALSHDEEFGTWGGSTEAQREIDRSIRKSAEGQMAARRVAAA